MARELKYRAFDTDFSSLAAELRGSEGHEVPAAYADLAETPAEDTPDDSYEDLRKSG